MRQGRFGWTAVFALVLALACALGIAALGGKARGLLAPALTADVALAAFPLPNGMRLDADAISAQLSGVMQKNAQDDVALRLALGGGAQEKLVEVVVPRLFSPQSVRSTLRDVPSLAAVLSIGEVRRSAVVTISNKGAQIDALALTMPGIVLAEAEGGALDIVTAEGGLTAIDLGPIAGGETKSLNLWLDARAELPPADFARLVRLGVDGRQSGLVRISGGATWHGADLEVLPWARWIVLTVLVTGFVAGLIGIAAVVAGAMRRPHRV
jgi:hypothetical protein